ncbi:Mur ligase domain-containing protein, partial [Polaribacter sp.]|nr:Mur ligase domain-containing protein [Polaribacter sp.]
MEVHQLVFDSRKIEKKDVFVAQKGVAVDGHLYIDKAISLGANTIVCETIPEAKKDGVTYV